MPIPVIYRSTYRISDIFGHGLYNLRYPAIDDHQVNVAGANNFGNPCLKSMEKMLTG